MSADVLNALILIGASIVVALTFAWVNTKLSASLVNFLTFVCMVASLGVAAYGLWLLVQAVNI